MSEEIDPMDVTVPMAIDNFLRDYNKHPDHIKGVLIIPLLEDDIPTKDLESSLYYTGGGIKFLETMGATSYVRHRLEMKYDEIFAIENEDD